MVLGLMLHSMMNFELLFKISDVLENTYIPALHGNLNILVHRVWAQENSAKVKSINEKIQKALKKISADYSVQSHFGKSGSIT